MDIRHKFTKQSYKDDHTSKGSPKANWELRFSLEYLVTSIASTPLTTFHDSAEAARELAVNHITEILWLGNPKRPLFKKDLSIITICLIRIQRVFVLTRNLVVQWNGTAWLLHGTTISALCGQPESTGRPFATDSGRPRCASLRLGCGLRRPVLTPPSRDRLRRPVTSAAPLRPKGELRLSGDGKQFGS